MRSAGAARLRRIAGRSARGLAGVAGFDLVRRGAPAPAQRQQDPSASGVITIPTGRHEPFSAGDYEVVPRGGFDVVRHDYYSPIPDLAALGEDVWTRRSPLGGVRLEVENAIGFVEGTLAPFVAELDVPVEDPGVPGSFFLANGGFESVDAELLYAVIRAMHPQRVIELGSGYSTLLISLACRRNAADGLRTRHHAYDPHPRPHILGEALTGQSALAATSATDVPLERFAELDAGDILFVDTTHTVKLASDVNFVILEVLPVLRSGVVVHFHDIFLPWEYPRQWFEQMGWYWAEQYLLQAFLAYNDTFEVLIPTHALAREQPERLGAVVPSFTGNASPGSMWLRRR